METKILFTVMEKIDEQERTSEFAVHPTSKNNYVNVGKVRKQMLTSSMTKEKSRRGGVVVCEGTVRTKIK